MLHTLHTTQPLHTGKNFYLERNYVNMMTYIGWNSAAVEVVDAAVHKIHSSAHSSVHSSAGSGDVGGGSSGGSDGKADAIVGGAADKSGSKDRTITSKANKIDKKAAKSTDSANKPIFPFIASITGDNMSRNMFVVAIVIGLVSYSVRVFYSRS